MPMADRALHLLAYDVAHPKRLRRALHAARRHATGGQKSAHECWLSGAERAGLLGTLRGLLHPRQDRLLAARLDPRLPPRCLGTARAPEPPGFRIIG
ncbi:CRISPR-associated endonuclease Cas2 [Crenalkalicoccus roseus]|uniref:CRISPR-associated endonuclease Cas2 n=1 Tax=Crenalkalicoccus roseus TaxID=1485588 RepID=UPI0013050E65|nr:CRISPR-associated endonuclease Cas2 [Crenalkalicoccus roseus]